MREPASGTGDTVCMALIGPGRDVRSWQAAFHAALRVLKSNERFHLFADARVTHRLRVWKHAREAGVLDRVSLTDDAEMRRDLVLKADILLYSDARGESRTLLLEAMAARVAIIAAADPLTDSLIDGTTARLVADTTEQQWVEAIEHLVREPAARRSLTGAAREYVQKHHRATRQIVSLIDAYEWVAGSPVRIGPESDVLGPGEA
jgi:glycosyltransferase involved in cell wall biosynthesis